YKLLVTIKFNKDKSMLNTVFHFIITFVRHIKYIIMKSGKKNISSQNCFVKKCLCFKNDIAFFLYGLLLGQVVANATAVQGVSGTIPGSGKVLLGSIVARSLELCPVYNKRLTLLNRTYNTNDESGCTLYSGITCRNVQLYLSLRTLKA
ncbi:hypothetical protein SFRURICE_009031, partial [Spodoptera frugiperda]